MKIGFGFGISSNVKSKKEKTGRFGFSSSVTGDGNAGAGWKAKSGGAVAFEFSSKVSGRLLAAGVATAVLAGCGASHDPSKKSPSSLSPVSAATATVERASLPDRLTLYGTVTADRSAAVSSRVTANVVAVPARVGQSVAAGDVLVEIDPQTAKGQEAQARGALAQARAALSLAERNYERYKALAASGSASPLELDMNRMQYEQAKGAVQQGEGAVEAASSVARESRVTAPFAGRVAARHVEAGDLAAPGRPLVTVESTTGRRLVVQVPAGTALVSGLSTGKKLAVKIDGVAADLAGTVVEMSPGADPGSHTYTATLELSGVPVASGLTGRAYLDGAPRPSVLVPESAVLASGGVSLVAIKDEEGKARTRVVTTGVARDGKVEILSGLSGGETVLVGLAAPPADGAPVSEPMAADAKGSAR
ncbi:MAG TPA: efflux RND transporter periplasmic adaptor subunit [Thermoanaerobaculia bacterium]|nr:efflux RND transporter periplasmic adaptor subunit [Thermoanaerobaculia bacterium]